MVFMILGIVVVTCAVLLVLQCCLKAASDADKDMEGKQGAEEGEQGQDSCEIL